MEEKGGKLRSLPSTNISMQGAFDERKKSNKLVWLEIIIEGEAMPFEFFGCKKPDR